MMKTFLPILILLLPMVLIVAMRRPGFWRLLGRGRENKLYNTVPELSGVPVENSYYLWINCVARALMRYPGILVSLSLVAVFYMLPHAIEPVIASKLFRDIIVAATAVLLFAIGRPMVFREARKFVSEEKEKLSKKG